MNNKLNCILLVDDNTADNRFHKIVIEKLNIAQSVKIVLSGNDALDFLNEENTVLPELILLDINMPRMDGWEFLENYNKLDGVKKSKITVVFLTTSINPLDMLKAEQNVDARGFYSKPLNDIILKEIFDRHFSHLKNSFD